MPDYRTTQARAHTHLQRRDVQLPALAFTHVAAAAGAAAQLVEQPEERDEQQQ